MKKPLEKPFKKRITLDDLAAMCAREFSTIKEGMAAMATKQDLENVWIELAREIQKVDSRLDSIAVNHEHRIRTLEDRVIYS